MWKRPVGPIKWLKNLRKRWSVPTLVTIIFVTTKTVVHPDSCWLYIGSNTVWVWFAPEIMITSFLLTQDCSKFLRILKKSVSEKRRLGKNSPHVTDDWLNFFPSTLLSNVTYEPKKFLEVVFRLLYLRLRTHCVNSHFKNKKDDFNFFQNFTFSRKYFEIHRSSSRKKTIVCYISIKTCDQGHSFHIFSDFEIHIFCWKQMKSACNGKLVWYPYDFNSPGFHLWPSSFSDFYEITHEDFLPFNPEDHPMLWWVRIFVDLVFQVCLIFATTSSWLF